MTQYAHSESVLLHNHHNKERFKSKTDPTFNEVDFMSAIFSWPRFPRPPHPRDQSKYGSFFIILFWSGSISRDNKKGITTDWTAHVFYVGVDLECTV